MKSIFRLVVLALVVAVAGPAAFAGTLSGVVRAIGGPGLRGTVRVKVSRLGEPVAEQWVGLDGRFRFDGVEPGPYDVSVDSFGYDSMSVPLNFLGSHPDLILELRSRAQRNSSRIAGQAKQELTRALDEQKKGNRKDVLAHLRKAALLGSVEAKRLLEELSNGR